MKLIDSHAHLDDVQFDGQRAAILDRARQAGIEAIVCVGTDLASSRRCLDLSDDDAMLFAAVGIQPNHVAQADPGDWQEIARLADHPRVVAIGETGLDHYWDFAPLELQETYFRRHLELALQKQLPFVVHMREPANVSPEESVCAAQILRVLQDLQTVPLQGVMHSFTGTAAQASAFVELGLHVSFAGMVTFKKSQALRQVAREVPRDRLLLETDAPYLAPQPKRGLHPNEPAWLVFTAACLAETLGIELDSLAELTTRNARALFRIGAAPVAE